jgi:hypothetical protein
VKRMLSVVTIVAAVAVVTAFSPGAGVASPGVPAGLVNAIHARFGPGLVRFSSRAGAKEPIAVFGYEVSLSADGTTALVGAPAVRADSGAAYIFHVSSAGAWASSSTPTASLTDSKGGYGAEFGVQVALSADGTTAFVGSPLNGPHGVIDVFHVPSEAAWASRSTPIAALTSGHGLFVGGSFAVSSDGTTVVAGAPFYDFFAGGAYVFHASSESAWASASTPKAVLTNLDESANDGFVGEAVAISGDGATALVSDVGAAKGGAYVFHVGSEAAWTSLASPTAILMNASGSARDALGNALALSGDGTTAVLGAPGANGNTGEWTPRV